MTRLHKDRNWKIEIYGREHGVPHFHLTWPGGRASITIETLEVIIGKPSATTLMACRSWAAANKALLWAT